jgi:LysM repeat protein/peptidoglycan/xylan/chitin deacetylase (PgdA/CDA1 family)
VLTRFSSRRPTSVPRSFNPQPGRPKAHDAPVLLHPRPIVAVLAAAVLAISVAAPATAAPDPGTTHTVESGDTLSEIAAEYGVSLDTVLELNGLERDSVIHPGDIILLTGAAAAEEGPAEDESSGGGTHTVRSGDTLGEIADEHGVSLDALLELNGLDRSSIIYPGDVLVLSGEADAATGDGEESTGGGTYTVRSGDTLGEIADAHGVSLDTLLELNGLDRSSIIYPGDVIRLPGGDSEASAAPEGDSLRNGPNDSGRVILTYDDCPRSLDAFADVVSWADSNEIGLVIAPTGDCIQDFESRHGVDIADLARENGQWVINHSISHRDLTTLSCADGADELGAPGVVTNFGRPPYGALDSDAYCAYEQVDMNPWLWNVDTRDWTGKSEAEVVASVVGNAQAGSTVLMHLQWNGFSSSAIGQMRDGLAERGLELCRDATAPTPVDLPSSLPC